MKYLILLLGLFVSVSFQAQDKKVLIIGIDGVRPDALEAADTPNIDALIANGIFSPDALNDDITSSGPGWSSILCSVWSDKHGVTDNSFAGENYGQFPPLFARVEAFNPELSTASICHWAPINDEIVQTSADFVLNVTSDEDLSAQSVIHIAGADPDFMFIHFDDVDHAGHSYGYGPDIPEYISSIEQVDYLMGPIMLAIINRPDYANEDWLILVTTDHGGLGFGHGGNSIEEERVFVLASGNSVDQELIEAEGTWEVNPVANCLGENIPRLEFDGAGDYIHVPQSELFNFGANDDFSVECRVRTTVAADVAIIGNKDWDSGLNPGFVLSYAYPNGPEWKVNIGDGTERADLEIGGEIADGEWHTLSVTFDRDGTMRMFQDGMYLGEEDISAVGSIDVGDGLYIGSDIFGAYSYTGAIAEVRIWDGLLEDATVNDWACTSINDTHPNYAGLLGYWKMDEGTGTSVPDQSDMFNNADIIEATWTTSDSTYVQDFSTTPRQVDIAVTGLTHLCIPIENEWDLDGVSLIGACLTDNITEHASALLLYPNPAQNRLYVSGVSASDKLVVRDSLGRVIWSGTLSNGQGIDTSAWALGMYGLYLTSEGTNSFQSFVVSR